MQRKHFVPLTAAALATCFVAWMQPSKSVAAGGGVGGNGVVNAATLDSDGDFLPDAVEWVVLTNANNPDTDGDTVGDFVEVVEAGLPRHESSPLPADQQMRLVMTGPGQSSTDPRTWMHVFIRVMTAELTQGSGATAIQSFESWLEGPAWPGLQFPLNAFAGPDTVYRERITQNDGVWVQMSIPLVSEAMLAAVLPATIWAETVIDGQSIKSGMKLINTPAGISSLVPYTPGRFVFQTLSPVTLPLPLVAGPNQVCVLELEEQTSGTAGTTYQVVDADCEDANELECSQNCQQSVGWVVTIPGGTDLIGGQ